MKLAIKILSIVVIILLFVAMIVFFMTNQGQTNSSPKEDEILNSATELGYTNVTSVETNELAKKYVGTKLDSFIVVNSNTNEEIDLCSVEGIKIIEVFSSYCDACMNSLTSASEFAKQHKDVLSFFSVGKEYNSAEKEVFDTEMEVWGYDDIYYYIPGDLPVLYGKMYNTAKPSYIVLNDENTIIEVCDGGLNGHTPKEVFGSLADVIEEDVAK